MNARVGSAVVEFNFRGARLILTLSSQNILIERFSFQSSNLGYTYLECAAAACLYIALFFECHSSHIYAMHHNRQRISLHDLTALRIDVNGERVKPARARSRKQALSGRSDTRGNVLAARPFIKPYKHKLESGDEGMGLVEGVDRDYSSNRKRQKRNNYHPDLLPFLHPPSSATQLSATDQDADTLPSSDLLKVVHYFASCYYDERGLLTGSATAAKRERRSKATQSRENPPLNEVREEDLENDWEEDDGNLDQALGEGLVIEQISSPRKSPRTSSQTTEKPSKARRIKPREATPTPENRIKDMHRAFDGSALLLVGMILQSHIESRINRPPPLPSEWEEQVGRDKDRIITRSLGGRKRSKPIREPEADERARTTRSGERTEDSESDSEGVGTKVEMHHIQRDHEMQVEYSGFNDAEADSEKDQSV